MVRRGGSGSISLDEMGVRSTMKFGQRARNCRSRARSGQKWSNSGRRAAGSKSRHGSCVEQNCGIFLRFVFAGARIQAGGTRETLAPRYVVLGTGAIAMAALAKTWSVTMHFGGRERPPRPHLGALFATRHDGTPSSTQYSFRTHVAELCRLLVCVCVSTRFGLISIGTGQKWAESTSIRAELGQTWAELD